MSTDEKTIAKTYRLSKGYETALRTLAQAGHVTDPDEFKSRTEVGAVRQAIRDAWSLCEQTRNLPFPGDE